MANIDVGAFVAEIVRWQGTDWPGIGVVEGRCQVLREIAVELVECPWQPSSELTSTLDDVIHSALQSAAPQFRASEATEIRRILVQAATEYHQWKPDQGKYYVTTAGDYYRVVKSTIKSSETLVQGFSNAFPEGRYTQIERSLLGSRISHQEMKYAQGLGWPIPDILRRRLLTIGSSGLTSPTAAPRIYRSLAAHLEAVVRRYIADRPSHLYRLTVKRRGALRMAIAYGYSKAEEFVVKQGSTTVPVCRPSASRWLKEMHKDLIDSGVLISSGDLPVFTRDFSFKARSTAAGIVSGGNSEARDWRAVDK